MFPRKYRVCIPQLLASLDLILSAISLFQDHSSGSSPILQNKVDKHQEIWDRSFILYTKSLKTRSFRFRAILLYCFLQLNPHVFLMGFGSGDCYVHCKTFILWSVNYSQSTCEIVRWSQWHHTIIILWYSQCYSNM